nr:aminodeoxychorismate/anthranilate synthase component II [Aliidiomarina indica]
MIDNYDSFTHNLARYFQELGQQVRVVRNDEIDVADIDRLAPSALVISPGPCTPNEAGISLAAIEACAGKIPILGVCLGHQAIGQVFGGRVVRAQQVMHGKRSLIQHFGSPLFSGLPETFSVVRYHSLVVDAGSFPDCLQIDARVVGKPMDGHAAGEIMGLSHRELPIMGVQFHPESVLSSYGHDILENFCKLIDINSVENGAKSRIRTQREPLPSA